jgi:gluconokinase
MGMIIVVTGVMGAGKTTVGAALAARLGWRFLDADDYHAEESWAKLARGEPLTDEERQPWLERLRSELDALLARGESAVLACSALRESHRRRLTPDRAAPGDVRFVYLQGDAALIAQRVADRSGHRAAPALLDSQFTALEEPRDALWLPARESPAELVERVLTAWGLRES